MERRQRLAYAVLVVGGFAASAITVLAGFYVLITCIIGIFRG